tara:strand:- start:4679 stop:5437 length:759 start_codon:yes stop_codon:yes gene_type:complete
MLDNDFFYKDDWIWTSFQNYLISKLSQYDCKEYQIPSEYMYKESTYGSKTDYKKVALLTTAVTNERINFCRSVCINSPSYSVLNFLIIPNTLYNIPFFGLDFVSLPNYHLLVLDFQPSIKNNKQIDKTLLNQLLIIKNEFHQKVPMAEKMSDHLSKFFSPCLIWSKLPIDLKSKELIKNYLYPTFQKYLNLYLESLHKAKQVDSWLQEELIKGQNNYLDYRKSKDPARPMLKLLFGETFTESLINKLLFKAK